VKTKQKKEYIYYKTLFTTSFVTNDWFRYNNLY